MGLANPLHVVFLLIILAFWLIPSWLVAMYAEKKGHPFWGFLLIGLFLSWVIALIIALVVADRRSTTPSAPVDELDQLERLAVLHERGALTAEEFAAKKAMVLAQED